MALPKVVTVTGQISKIERTRSVTLRDGERKRVWEFIIKTANGVETMADAWEDVVEGHEWKEGSKFTFYGQFDGVLHVKRIKDEREKERVPSAVERVRLDVKYPNSRLELLMDKLGAEVVSKAFRDAGLSATPKKFLQEKYLKLLDELEEGVKPKPPPKGLDDESEWY